MSDQTSEQDVTMATLNKLGLLRRTWCQWLLYQRRWRV